MAEDPEEMHPHHGRASGLGIEEMRAQIAVEQQHDLRGGSGENHDQHQARGHQVQPHQQRHLAQRHARAAHAEDGRNDVDAVPMLPMPLTSSPMIQ